MTTLASLTYEPRASTSQAVAALNAMDRAAQNMGAAIETADRKVGRTNATFDAIARRFSDVERAQQAIIRATAVHTRAMDDATRAANAEGASQQRLQALLDQIGRAKEQAALRAVQGLKLEQAQAALTATGYANLARNMGQVNTTARATQQQVQQLVPQLNDLFVSVASGGSAFTAMIQQGPQITQIFGGLASTARAAAAALGPVGIGAAVIGAAVVSLGAIFNSRQGEIAAMRVQLDGIAAAYRGTAEAADAAARSVARSGIGVSVTQARGAQVSLARAAAGAGVQGLDYAALTRDAANLAARLGEDLPAALGRLESAIRDPAAAVEDFRRAGLDGMTGSLRNAIQSLRDGGASGEAFARLLAELQRQSAGAARDGMSPLGKAAADVRSEFGLIWDAIEKGVGGEGSLLLTWLQQVAAGWRRLREEMPNDQNAPLFGGRSLLGELWNRLTGSGPTGQTSSPSSATDLMAAIRRTEGGARDPYNNTLDNNRWTGGRAYPLTFMPIGSVMEVQERIIAAQRAAGVERPSGAIGAYQITQGTLAAYVRQLGISRDEIFSPDLQDRLGRAIAASAGDPTSPGWLDRIRGQFHGLRSVPDDQLRALGAGGTVQITAQRVDVDTPAPAAARGSIIEVTPRVTDPVERALNQASGGPGAIRLNPAMSPELNARRAGAALDVLRSGLAVATDPGQIAEITKAIQDMNAAVEAGRSPAENIVRAQRDQAAVLRQLDPVQREITQAIQEANVAERARSGQNISAAREAEIAASVLERLGRQYAEVTNSARLQADSAGRVAEAYGRSTEAGRHQENVERAMVEVRQRLQGTDEQRRQAAELLAREYDRLAENAARAKQAEQNRTTEDELALLRRENELVGESVVVRERELAVMRARQQAERNRTAGTAEGERSVALAAEVATQRAISSESKRITDDVVNFASERFADFFSETGGGWRNLWESMRRTALATLSKIAAEALIRPIITPIVTQFVGGGGVTGLLGAAGSVAGAGGAATQPGSNALSTASGGLGLLNRLGSLGNIFDLGGGLGGSAWGFIDRNLGTGIGAWMNSPAFGGGLVVPGPGDMGGTMFNGQMVSPMGLSYGQAIGGAAGIAGGAYGLYNAFQTGGARGWAQGVGSVASIAGGGATIASGLGVGGAALAGVAAVAPYVAIIAAIVAMMLPGAKPSDRQGNFTYNTATRTGFEGGQEGDKRSDENRAQAKAMAEQLGKLADQVRATAGLSQPLQSQFIVGFGDRDGAYLQLGADRKRYGDDEESAKQMADAAMRYFLQRAAEQSDDRNVATVIGRSLGGGVDATMNNLTWYRDVYQVLTDTTERTSAWAQALEALIKPFDDALAKTRELGLSEEVLTAKRTEAIAAAEKSRTDQFDTSILGMLNATAELRGGDMTAVALKQFDAQRTLDWEALVKGIWDQGFDQNQVDVAWSVFGPLKALQRQVLERQTTRAAEDRAMSIGAIQNNLDNAMMRAQGRNEEADESAYRFQRRTEELTLRRQLQDFGFGAAEAAMRLGQFEQVTKDTIEAMKKQEDQQALSREQGALTRIAGAQGMLTDFLNGLATGPGASPQNAFLAQQQAFAAEVERARAAGLSGADLARVTSAASSLLTAGDSYLGRGREGAALQTMVESTIRSLGASLDLPAFGGQLERAMAPLVQVRDASQQLRDEILKLREEIRTMRLRAA